MRASDRVPLGRTPLTVTRLGLGTAPIGGLYQSVADESAAGAIAASWEAGLRLYDTAPLYGEGLSERRLGDGLRGRPRGEYTIATKVGRVLVGEPPRPVFDFSRDGVMRAFESSLERLGLDAVDVLHIHDPDDHYEQALREAYPALDELRRAGVVRAIGAGMNQAEMLSRFAREADFDCFLLAGRYTLLDQVGLVELLPLCAERGIAVIAGGVYNSGVLADPRPTSHYNYATVSPAVLERARRLEAVCGRHRVPLKAAAIQFPLGHPAVVSVLTGARSPAELEDTLAMSAVEIPPDLWAELKAEGLLPEEAPTP
jgi:D-threo-aldose 1-dehydrogenase